MSAVANRLVIGALTGLGLFLTDPAAAALLPSIVYTAPQTVGPGTTYYTGVSSSPNPKWQVRVIEVNLAERNVALQPVRRAGTTLQKTSVLAAGVGALAAINAGYFDGSTGASYGYFKLDGQLLGNNAVSQPPRAVFGFSGNYGETMLQARVDGTSGQPVPANANWSKVMYAIGAGPTLVTAGAVDVGDTVENFGTASGIDPTGRQPRSAIGFDAARKRAWLVTVDGRQSTWSVGMTLVEMAQLLLDLGCKNGMNLDGGGSTTCWVNGAVANRPSDGSERSVATVWAVVPAYIVDNESSDCSRSASWNQVTATGMFGPSSLTSPTGGGSEWIRWNPNLALSGRYDVFAWWPAVSGAAGLATFTVTRPLGNTDVQVNLLLNTTRWNLLGSFNFAAGSGGTVTLTDSGPAGRSMNADAIKFVRTGPPDPARVEDALMY